MLVILSRTILPAAFVLGCFMAAPAPALAAPPGICTMEYLPVCGFKRGRWRTYPNRCSALNEGARAIRRGACSRHRR